MRRRRWSALPVRCGSPASRARFAAMTATEEAPKKTIKEPSENFIQTYKPSSTSTGSPQRARSRDGHEDGEQPPRGPFHVDRVRKRERSTSGSSSTAWRELKDLPLAEVELLLLSTTDPRYRAVILLAAEAGLRVGEIRGLQWTDIMSGQLTVRRALDKLTNEAVAPKHNKTRTVPLSPRLAAVLQDLPRQGLWGITGADGSFVPYDVLSAAVNATYELANVRRPPKPIDGLRHTCGTVMASGCPCPCSRSSWDAPT